MLMRHMTAFVFVLAASVAGAGAQEFQIVKVASVAGSAVDNLKPKTIFFNDHRVDETSDKGAFIRFDEWSRTKPVQRQFLSLFPTYLRGHDPSRHRRIEEGGEGRAADVHHRGALQAVSAGRLDRSCALRARCPSSRASIRRSSIKIIKPSDVSVLKDEKSANNKNPNRPWCEGPASRICTHSTYKLEGKLPIGIALANKLRDSDKKVSDTVEFESELRILKGSDLDEAALQKLTGVNTPVAGVLEQNMFYVNQVMRFGKLIAVVQPSPADANSSIATVMIALAVSSHTLDTKKKYQDVPVLRNMVPSQVLLGQSSFNTGNSLSAGLPIYVRNRIKAIAGMLDRG